MDDARNPYATPKAEITAAGGTPFFATPTAKLAALSVVTFGLYEVIWAYQSWKSVRARTGKPIRPFWRALFAPLWMFILFDELNRQAAAAEVESSVSPGGHGAAFFVLSALWRLPAPWFFIGYLSFLPLLPANTLARRLNERLAPETAPMVGWSGVNVAALLLGGVLFALVVAGTFLPEE
jgi:hypothetical protein